MTHPTDAKFQPGDHVVYNPFGTHENYSKHDRDAVIISVYKSVIIGKQSGDYAYEIEYSNGGRNQIWGHCCRIGMFKYDPKQAGDTEEDI